MIDNVKKFEQALHEDKELAKTQELDLEELDQVSGGFCWHDYDCYTAWRHDTPDGEGTACFANNDCIIAAEDSWLLPTQPEI